MPDALRFFAENQPLTHVIQAMRVWFVDTPVGNSHELAFVRSASLFDMIGYLTRVINQCSDNSRGVSSLYTGLAFEYSDLLYCRSCYHSTAPRYWLSLDLILLYYRRGAGSQN